MDSTQLRTSPSKSVSKALHRTITQLGSHRPQAWEGWVRLDCLAATGVRVAAGAPNGTAGDWQPGDEVDLGVPRLYVTASFSA